METYCLTKTQQITWLELAINSYAIPISQKSRLLQCTVQVFIFTLRHGPVLFGLFVFVVSITILTDSYVRIVNHSAPRPCTIATVYRK